MGRRRIKRGPGQQQVLGSEFRLAEEIRYIQRRAAHADSRIVSIGPLLLFSTETGDAWLLDPADQLALPLAREGAALPAHIEDTATRFAVEWTGHYRLEGDLFVYRDTKSGSLRSIFGYPTQRIAQQISKMIGAT
jgi:hypothetical protein